LSGVFGIETIDVYIVLSARISDQEIKVYWGISKKLNPKNGRVKVCKLGVGISDEKFINSPKPLFCISAAFFLNARISSCSFAKCFSTKLSSISSKFMQLIICPVSAWKQ